MAMFNEKESQRWEWHQIIFFTSICSTLGSKPEPVWEMLPEPDCIMNDDFGSSK
jgi:hypothetical protein